MADPRALDAINRIERALARIEGAAARPAAAADTGDTEELARLQQSHERLRARVSGALAQLDGLIQSGARG